MAKHADQWWRDQVMAILPLHHDGSLRRPLSKSEVYEIVAEDVNLPRFPKEEYIDRAMRQLRDAGMIHYFADWQGWQVPDFEELYEERRQQERRDHEARLEAIHRRTDETRKAHDALMLAHWKSTVASLRQRGVPEHDLPAKPEPSKLYYPDYSRRQTIISKLQAKADSTEFPGEAASLLAKIAELQAMP